MANELGSGSGYGQEHRLPFEYRPPYIPPHETSVSGLAHSGEVEHPPAFVRRPEHVIEPLDEVLPVRVAAETPDEPEMGADDTRREVPLDEQDTVELSNPEIGGPPEGPPPESRDFNEDGDDPAERARLTDGLFEMMVSRGAPSPLEQRRAKALEQDVQWLGDADTPSALSNIFYSPDETTDLPRALWLPGTARGNAELVAESYVDTQLEHYTYCMSVVRSGLSIVSSLRDFVTSELRRDIRPGDSHKDFFRLTGSVIERQPVEAQEDGTYNIGPFIVRPSSDGVEVSEVPSEPTSEAPAYAEQIPQPDMVYYTDSQSGETRFVTLDAQQRYRVTPTAEGTLTVVHEVPRVLPASDAAFLTRLTGHLGIHWQVLKDIAREAGVPQELLGTRVRVPLPGEDPEAYRRGRTGATYIDAAVGRYMRLGAGNAVHHRQQLTNNTVKVGTMLQTVTVERDDDFLIMGLVPVRKRLGRYRKAVRSWVAPTQ